MKEPSQKILQFSEELVAAICEKTRTLGLLRSDFPRLTSHGSQQRMKAVMTGQGKGAVNFPSILRKFAKETFPDFTFVFSRGDHHLFEKALTGNVYLLLLFEKKHHFGLGKAFTISLGFEKRADAQPIKRLSSLFDFFERERLEWTYWQKDDLRACLDEAALLLRHVLPRYQAEWQIFDGHDESPLLSSAPRHGDLSFREAARIAHQAIARACPEYSISTSAWLRSRAVSTPHYPLLADDAPGNHTGRAASWQAWSVRLADQQSNRTMIVRVPHTGRLGFVRSDDMYINRNGAHHRLSASYDPNESLALPLSSSARSTSDIDAQLADIVDSPNAVAVAETAGGADYRRRNPDSRMDLSLHAEISDPPLRNERWYVEYFKAPGRSERLSITVSAREPAVIRQNPQSN
jgi:hypothetical protein